MGVDLAAVTEKQRAVWGLGDYGRVGSLLTWIGESLVREVDVRAGERVLDVAAGNGSASLPAARRFADVLATDYVPALLEEARRRAEADCVELRTQVADAQDLPFGDGSFDVVLSTIGVMFAPDQQAAARELARVCRGGGRIGVAAWTPDSMVGGMLRAVSARVPPPPGVLPPVTWGDEEHVRGLLGPYVRDLRAARRTCAFRFRSAEHCVEHFRTWYGPTVAAFRAVGEEGADDLAAELAEVYRAHSTATDGTLAMDVPYLEVVAVRA
ncbi:class I SAM-dependent methyltransferase [Vallicoccus soli]|uniref:Class I SAM-dependent methyltransferase n=1 Tax=Vallicoccus soli TaxID=2339232 RepID=A0A3A3YUA5_9ACTN|nr:class I SAM-dependent methyltransferase [Vallicoccus soli]RJK92646.1 class I SAM-dependent methyltransferase [Vallicoccus soli]